MKSQTFIAAGYAVQDCSGGRWHPVQMGLVTLYLKMTAGLNPPALPRTNTICVENVFYRRTGEIFSKNLSHAVAV